MNAVPLLVLLQAGEGEGSPFTMLVPMALIFMIFYFLLIRPQQKRQKDHEKLLKSIEKGDRVVTSGGIQGRVTGVSEDTLTVDIASQSGQKMLVKVARAKIESRQSAKKGEES
jgi:preprotein translocase subunit YajC